MESESKVVSPLPRGASDLYALADNAHKLAVEHAWETRRPDGHWNGELLSNATITAEQVFFYQSLGMAPIPDGEAYRHYLLSQQQKDGSWSIAPDYPGDISTSAEAYLALKMLGVSQQHEAMRRGRAFIRRCGGIAKARVFTRFFFAQFGLFPWDATPQLPAEFILCPSFLPINVYRLSSWARSTLIPLLIIRHHQKIYPLPESDGKADPRSKYLDELWIDPGNKNVPYGPSLVRPWESDLWSLMFGGIDTALYWLGGLKPFWPVRRYARRKCVEWILDRQEKQVYSGGGERGSEKSTATWSETQYTGTGFPNFFYIGYSLYRHYFPIMALGRYLSACRKTGVADKIIIDSDTGGMMTSLKEEMLESPVDSGYF
ncbi:terpenoid cyclases/protein prenyltransferase alpha-alpha toroid [Apiospora phragmitis]|uniref:Terpenoid cyclases/protein prenyltransferase alpha-alpha toroid n=1 Tax=Apiospora phragmitis TaxID=2905665 RepID=A0ABR1VW73_9PEZI